MINSTHKTYPQTPVYLATDFQGDIYIDPAWQDFVQVFPCIVQIKNFDEVIRRYVSNLSRDHILARGLDGYTWALIDHVVSSRGRFFVGTYGSTFSAYSLALHNNFVQNNVDL